MSIYFDRHTTYKSPAKQTTEEKINGDEKLSEFGRVLEELGIQRIYAFHHRQRAHLCGEKYNRGNSLETGYFYSGLILLLPFID